MDPTGRPERTAGVGHAGTPPPSAALVGRAQLGDLRALDALLRLVQAPLFHHVRTIVGDEQLTEDALQEALLAVSRKIGTLRDPRWFRAWAYRIATREAVRHARRARRRPETVDPVELESVEDERTDAPFDPELIEAIPGAIDSLPPASRLVVRMHYVDGLTLVEVAEALEISVGTVKSRLSYGLASLRRTLGRGVHRDW